MKHAVSVAELLELHRLGELYLQWTATPFSMSEVDLQELQEISDRYQINHSSALFSFQKQYQREMAVNIERSVDKALETIPGLAQALSMVSTAPIDATYQPPAPIAAERADILREENERVTRQFAKEDPDGPHAALLEQIHEDNEMDRQDHREAAFERAAELRQELDSGGNFDDEREIEILREISNVDELTNSESARLDELVERAQLSQDAVIAPGPNSVPIPSGVVQDAITTGHIQKVK